MHQRLLFGTIRRLEVVGQRYHTVRMIQHSTTWDKTPLPRWNAVIRTPRNSNSFVTITQTKAAETLAPPAAEETSPVTPAQSQFPSTTNLTITDACWKQIHHLTHNKPDNPYLRLYVDAGGCSGFQYKFELDTAPPDKEDVVLANNNVRLVIDTGSLDFLQGATVDYVQEMIKSAFAVTNNPQSESACGCGSSFALKNFAANPASD